MNISLGASEQMKDLRYSVTYEKMVPILNQYSQAYIVKLYIPNNRITKYNYVENKATQSKVTVASLFAVVP